VRWRWGEQRGGSEPRMAQARQPGMLQGVLLGLRGMGVYSFLGLWSMASLLLI
jgi:hypothetical protein